MKLILLLTLLFTGFCFYVSRTEQKPEKKDNNVLLAADIINFQKKVMPIFQKNCTPCHFPGGKMYARMPFDKGETILNHEAGILKRIKKEDEQSLIKQFIQQNK